MVKVFIESIGMKFAVLNRKEVSALDLFGL